MRLFVTGACGYKGTCLVPKLLDRGWEVIALDTMWFGNFLPAHENLTIHQADVRETEAIDPRASRIRCTLRARGSFASILSSPSTLVSLDLHELGKRPLAKNSKGRSRRNGQIIASNAPPHKPEHA